jgi:hypothetical protein
MIEDDDTSVNSLDTVTLNSLFEREGRKASRDEHYLDPSLSNSKKLRLVLDLPFPDSQAGKVSREAYVADLLTHQEKLKQENFGVSVRQSTITDYFQPHAGAHAAAQNKDITPKPDTVSARERSDIHGRDPDSYTL